MRGLTRNKRPEVNKLGNYIYQRQKAYTTTCHRVHFLPIIVFSVEQSLVQLSLARSLITSCYYIEGHTDCSKENEASIKPCSVTQATSDISKNQMWVVLKFVRSKLFVALWRLLGRGGLHGNSFERRVHERLYCTCYGNFVLLSSHNFCLAESSVSTKIGHPCFLLSK